MGSRPVSVRMTKWRGTATVLAAGMLLACAFGSALAQNYPSRSVRLIVPYAPGGPTDTVARITSNAMSKVLGQTFVVENIAGAGGTLGAERAARAAPDGYTLLIHHLGLATAATIYRKLPFDVRTAFTPIGIATDAPLILVARSDFTPGTLRELIDYTKSHGNAITFGNAGLGSASNLCGLMFMAAIKQELTSVAYKGGGPFMNDLIGRHIDLGCEQATTATGPILAKQVKAYAVTTRQRLASVPDLPTADEAGLPGFEVNVWHGLFGPQGLPGPIVRTLSDALQKALQDPDTARRLTDINTVPVARERATPEALDKLFHSEIDRWAPLIRDANQFVD